MHICFLSSMHPAYDKRVFEKEALSLVLAGHKVTHLCPGDESEAGPCRGVEVITYPRPSGIKGRLFQLFKLYSLASMMNADVYHCNEVDSWFIGVLLKISRKSACVFDVHEHYPSTFVENRFPNWMKSSVMHSVRILFKLFMPFTDRLVLAKKTVSSDFYCEDSKKTLARNYAHTSGLNISGDRIPLNVGGIVTLIHLGLINKARGWPQILDALNLMKHKNVRLEIIGEFGDGTRDEFDVVVNDYNLQDRVVVRDWMPFEEAFNHLIKSHIGLVLFQPGILNHDYAMPHKMFDYMAAGMAVICPSFAVEVAPVIEESNCGLLVNPASPKKLADNLDYLVENPSIIHAMGKRGQQAVKEKYNWEAEAEELIEMYDELAKACDINRSKKSIIFQQRPYS